MAEKGTEAVKNFKLTMGVLRKELPETAETLLNLIRTVHKEGALSPKEKELICVGISIAIGCETCIVMHTKAALEAGATKEEIMEVFGVALTLRGSSAIGHVSIGINVINELSSKQI